MPAKKGIKKRKRRGKSIAQTSPNIIDQQVEWLKEIFPEFVSDGKIDYEKLRLTLGDKVSDEPQRYSFTWAGKRDAIGLLQMPTRATLVPAKEESISFDETQNLFIEGDNLEVLKLLYKTYAGRIKMIYLDPPYNTGQDFVYPDNYSDPLHIYLQISGQKDAEGNLLTSNPETSGRYHSTWLSMIYPRLFFARKLLSEDGLICVSIDDKEVFNLRHLMNEIFGEENFIAQFVWKSRQNVDNRNITGASIDHEYVLCYGRKVRGRERDTSQYKNPDNDPRGDWVSANMVGLLPEDQRPGLHHDLIDPKTGVNYGRPRLGWRYDEITMKKLIEDDRILWPDSEEGRPRRKVFLSELQRDYVGYSSIIGEGIYTHHGTSDIEELFGERVMSFPKPVALMKDLLVQGCTDNDIVLDFFAGSCTTAQAVLELNADDNGSRRYIMIQLPEPTPEGSPAQKEGYGTIAEIGKERIRRVISRLTNDNKDNVNAIDLGVRVFKLSESNFKSWEGVEEDNAISYAEAMELFIDPLKPGWAPEDVIYEVAIKEGYGLNLAIEKVKKSKKNKVWKVADTDEDQSFYICLDKKVTKGTASVLDLKKDELFVCRDIALTDEIAANLALQCRLRTI